MTLAFWIRSALIFWAAILVSIRFPYRLYCLGYSPLRRYVPSGRLSGATEKPFFLLFLAAGSVVAESRGRSSVSRERLADIMKVNCNNCAYRLFVKKVQRFFDLDFLQGGESGVTTAISGGERSMRLLSARIDIINYAAFLLIRMIKSDILMLE